MLPDPKNVPIGQPHTNRRGTINHLRLTVTDLQRSKGFYIPVLDELGYRLVEESATRLAWASWAPHGTLHWLIMSISDPDKPQRHDRYTPGFHHLAWNVESREAVDGFHDMLAEAGIEILDPPAEYEYEPGYYAFFFSDPDGLKLEVMHVEREGSLEYWNRVSQSESPLKPLEISEPIFVRERLGQE